MAAQRRKSGTEAAPWEERLKMALEQHARKKLRGADGQDRRAVINQLAAEFQLERHRLSRFLSGTAHLPRLSPQTLTELSRKLDFAEILRAAPSSIVHRLRQRTTTIIVGSQVAKRDGYNQPSNVVAAFDVSGLTHLVKELSGYRPIELLSVPSSDDNVREQHVENLYDDLRRKEQNIVSIGAEPTNLGTTALLHLILEPADDDLKLPFRFRMPGTELFTRLTELSGVTGKRGIRLDDGWLVPDEDYDYGLLMGRLATNGRVLCVVSGLSGVSTAGICRYLSRFNDALTPDEVAYALLKVKVKRLRHRRGDQREDGRVIKLRAGAIRLTQRY